MARSTAWPRATRRSPTPSATRRDVFKMPLLGMIGTLHEKRLSRARPSIHRRVLRRPRLRRRRRRSSSRASTTRRTPSRRRPNARAPSREGKVRTIGGLDVQRRRRNDLRAFRHAERAWPSRRPCGRRDARPIVELTEDARWRRNSLPAARHFLSQARARPAAVQGGGRRGRGRRRDRPDRGDEVVQRGARRRRRQDRQLPRRQRGARHGGPAARRDRREHGVSRGS